jgi:hypothetical protein
MKIALDEERASGEFFLGQRDAIDGVPPRHDDHFYLMGWNDAAYEKSLGRDGWHLNEAGELEPQFYPDPDSEATTLTLDQRVARDSFRCGQEDAIAGLPPRYGDPYYVMGWEDAAHEISLGRTRWHLDEGMQQPEPIEA